MTGFESVAAKTAKELGRRYQAYLESDEELEVDKWLRRAEGWFECCRITSIEEDVVRLSCPKIDALYVPRYLHHFEDALCHILGRKVNVVLSADDDNDCPQQASLDPKSPIDRFRQKRGI
jgi:hypothetical protein